MANFTKTSPPKYTRPFSFRNSIEISTIEDFNSVAQDIMFDFVSSIACDERYATETGFNEKGENLLRRSKYRLRDLAEKIFSKEEMESFDCAPYIWDALSSY